MTRGPGTAAGLRVQDLIIAIDAKPVWFTDEVAVLSYFAGIRKGQRVDFTVVRGARTLLVSVIAGPMPAGYSERIRLSEELARRRSAAQAAPVTPTATR